MADLEARMATVEFKVDEHGRRIDGLESDTKLIHQNYTDQRLEFTKLQILIENSVAQNDKTMSLLKWVVIVAVAVIGAVVGVKIAIPSI